MKPIYMAFTNKETKETFVTVHHTNLSVESFLKIVRNDSKIYGKRNIKSDHRVISKDEYDNIVSTTKKEKKSSIEAKSK